jgi:hypothetical protein
VQLHAYTQRSHAHTNTHDLRYACFVDPFCLECVTAMYSAIDGRGNGTKADAFRSPACTATTPFLLNSMADTCLTSFPSCTMHKQRCASSSECASCLATLGAGDGAGAARQCRGSTQPSATVVDSVVDYCINSDAVACDFWRQRCADNVNCGECLDGIGNGNIARVFAAEWSAPSCQRAMQDFFALHYLYAISRGCPGISKCRNAVTNCLFQYGEPCIACINGLLPANSSCSAYVDPPLAYIA